MNIRSALNPTRVSCSYFLSLFLIGIALVLLATSIYGPGISGDAVDYLSTADNLSRGLGFIDFAGDPYVYWPPLYPLLLAASQWLTRMDILEAGRLLNALGFGLTAVLTGLLFWRSFAGKRLWAMAGGLVALSSISLLRVAANIGSDSLFVVLVLTFALLASRYSVEQKTHYFWPMVFVSGLAAITRWSGVTLIASMFFVVLLVGRAKKGAAIRKGVFCGVLATIPFAVWVVGRNYRLLGTFMGSRSTRGIDASHNLRDALSRMSHWMLPRTLTDHIPTVAILVLGLVFLLLINHPQQWKNLVRRLASPLNYPYWIFTLIYFGFILATTISADHPFYYDDRYYLPIFPFFFLFTGIVLDELVLSHLYGFQDMWMRRGSLYSLVLLGGFFTWFLFPAFGVYKYVLVCRSQGEPSYNLYNTPKYRKSHLVKFFSELKIGPGATLYSNYPAAVYYFLRRESLRSPHTPLSLRPDRVYLLQNYATWPADGDAYLIWFKPNDWHNYYTPNNLKVIAEMTPIYKKPDGEVWVVRKKGSQPPG